jgi:hypothetical protein
MLTPTVLYRGQPGNTTTTLYTVTNTAGKHAIVKNIMICNPTAAAATISVASVASGGSESDANRFLKDIPVGAKTTIQLDLSMVLAQNESLRATASASATLTVIISGVIN